MTQRRVLPAQSQRRPGALMSDCRKHRALSLAPVSPACEACEGTGVLLLAAHWTGAEVDLPARVTCPHCSWPWLPIQTHYPRRSAS